VVSEVRCQALGCGGALRVIRLPQFQGAADCMLELVSAVQASTAYTLTRHQVSKNLATAGRREYDRFPSIDGAKRWCSDAEHQFVRVYSTTSGIV
jgi:hypothetical protein